MAAGGRACDMESTVPCQTGEAPVPSRAVAGGRPAHAASQEVRLRSYFAVADHFASASSNSLAFKLRKASARALAGSVPAFIARA